MLIKNILFQQISICRRNETLQTTGFSSNSSTLKDLTCLQLRVLSGNQHTLWRTHTLITLDLILLLPLFLKSILHLAEILIVLLKVHGSDFACLEESAYSQINLEGWKNDEEESIKSDKYDWKLRCTEFKYFRRCLDRYIPTSFQANKISTYYWEFYASVEGPNYISCCSEDSCNIHTSLMWNFIPYL